MNKCPLNRLIGCVTVTVFTSWFLWWTFGLPGSHSQSSGFKGIKRSEDFRKELQRLVAHPSEQIITAFDDATDLLFEGKYEQAELGYLGVEQQLATDSVLPPGKEIQALSHNLRLAQLRRQE